MYKIISLILSILSRPYSRPYTIIGPIVGPIVGPITRGRRHEAWHLLPRGSNAVAAEEHVGSFKAKAKAKGGAQ